MAFGTTVDYFGLADTKWQLLTSSKEPSSSNAQAMDSHGTVACETIFEEFYTYGNSYAIKSAATDTNGVIALNLDTKAVLGDIFAIDTNTNAALTNIEVATTNTTNPIVTVTGEQYFGDTQGQATFPSGVTLIGVPKATAFGFVLDTGTLANTAGVSLTAQVDRITDSVGDVCQTNVYQGRGDATVDMTACTGAGNAVADTANGWALSQQIGSSMDHNDYGPSTGSAYKNLARV